MKAQFSAFIRNAFHGFSTYRWAKTKDNFICLGYICRKFDNLSGDANSPNISIYVW